MQEIARRIAKVYEESKLPIVEEEYVQSFKVELMDAVVQWCRGASFSDICKARAFNFKCAPCPFVDLSALPAAHGPVRGQPYPCIPTVARTYSTDGSSCKGYWQR